MNKFYKVIENSEYDIELKNYYNNLLKFNKLYDKVSEILDENITRMAQTVDYLLIDKGELKKEVNIKVFKNDGTLKLSHKYGSEINHLFKKAVNELELSKFKDLRKINFIYGIMKNSNLEKLESFKTSNNDFYYKSNFELKNKYLIEIDELEYTRVYLNELEK